MTYNFAIKLNVREGKGVGELRLASRFLLSTTRKMIVLCTAVVLTSGRENRSFILSLLFEIGENIDTIGYKSVG